MADPLEYKNLYGDPAYAELREKLTLRMLTWLVRTSDVTPYEGHLFPKS